MTPAELECAVERNGARYLADMETIPTRVGQVYDGQLAAKDETIAELRRHRDNKREVLDKLRRRVKVAEAEADALRLRLAEVSIPAVVVVAGQETTEAPRATGGPPRPIGLYRDSGGICGGH